MPQIAIIVAPDGSSRVETTGFAGGACREASRFVEQALGRRTAEQLKPEFHQVESQPQHLQEGR